jgi:hypothetical protein
VVPEIDRHNGETGILPQDDVETVGEGVLLELQLWNVGCGRRARTLPVATERGDARQRNNQADLNGSSNRHITPETTHGGTEITEE